MKQCYYFIQTISVICFFFSHCKEPISNLPDHTQIKIRKALLGDGFQGMAFVAFGNKVVFRETISPSQEYRNKQLYKKTAFPLGENSKVFTAFAIRLLEQQGKLSLEDSVSKFFPDFPYPEIQIQHLLRHTSALPKYKEIERFKKPIKKGNQRLMSDLVTYQIPLSFKPGEYWKYTRIDYSVLAMVIEKITGMSFSQFINLSIFQPLQMTHSYVYEKDFFLGNSGVYSTPEDLLLFHQELLSPTLLSESQISKIFQFLYLKDSYAEDKVSFGDGVFLGDYFHWQFGKTKNLSCLVYLDRKSKISIILVNPWSGTTGELNSQKSHITEILFKAKKLIFSKKEVSEEETHISDLLKAHNVPGIGIAVYKNFKLDWKENYGVTNSETAALVTGSTLFRAGSLSKSAMAVLAVRLADQKKINLFQNIAPKLMRFRIENQAPKQFEFINLDSLLSHTSGLTEKGNWDLPENQGIETIKDLKDQYAFSNQNGLTIYYQPGSKSRYSSGGYSVIQEIIAETTKKPFSDSIQKLVFDPLGWKRSTFQQDPALLSDYMSGHGEKGEVLETKRFVTPELSSGGLWTTPEEMGRLFLEVAKAYSGQNSFLDRESARYLLQPKMSAANLTVHASVARGFFINETGPSLYFFHGGHTKGHKALAFFNPSKGYGAVIMTNSENGSPVIWKVLRALSLQEKWDKFVN